MKLYIINLTEEERDELTQLATSGRHAARKILHAKILLKADAGLADMEISEHLDVGIRTVERVRRLCSLEGLSAALNPKTRPQREPKIDGEIEARLIQLACSEPPSGRQRWTLRLLADKLVELEVIESISHETVRQRLEKKRAQALANAQVLHPPRTERRVRRSDGRRAGSLPAAV